MDIDQAAIKISMQRYLALANELRADHPTKADFNVFRGAALYSSSPELVEVHHAVVLSGEWFVIAGGRTYCDAYVDTPSPPLSAYLVGFGPPGITLLCEQPVEPALPHGFLLGGTRNYFHWLIDTLPRLELYRAHCGPLLINESLQPFQFESLALLGLGNVDRIALEYPRAYKVQKLFHPRTASTACMPPLTFQPVILERLREKFSNFRRPGKGWRKLFISRAGNPQAVARRLLNEAEIATVACECGFELVRCEELSFQAQITLFSEAAIIAGAHGAGLTNLVFAPEGTRIIEMIGPRYDRDRLGSRSYIRFAQLLRQHLIRIVGQSDQNVPIHLNHLSYETYTIDPAEFRRAIGN
jgi:Glycosyltransferase 61